MTTMRDLIMMVEDGDRPRGKVAPAELTAAIEATIQDYLTQAHISCVRDIGSGSCYDFAQAVFARLGAEHDYLHGEGPSGIQTIRTEDFWKDDFFADLRLLRKAGERIPRDIPPNALADLIGGATHEWIKLNGLYYDATAPKGVSHFLDLPFFADQIAGLRREIAARRSA
jgi:hypothetical protein